LIGSKVGRGHDDCGTGVQRKDSNVHKHLKVVVAVSGVLLISGGATAGAASLISGSQIKKNSIPLNRLTKPTQKKIQGVSGQSVVPKTVRSGDIANGTIRLADLSPEVLRALKVSGPTGQTGPAGQTGAPGPNGATGATGATGAKGADAVSKQTAFGQQFDGWGSNGCDNTGPKGTVGIDNDHVKFGPFTSLWASASIYTGVYNGMKLKDVSHVAYDAMYEQTGTDQHGGAPYLRFFLDDDNHDVIYSPNTQGRVLKSGEWHREKVTSGLLRYDDDMGAGGPGTYGVEGAPWETVKADHGNDVISGVYISAGCSGAYSDGTTSRVDNLSMTVGGKHAVYDFGK
jgi:hypothetical protein